MAQDRDKWKARQAAIKASASNGDELVLRATDADRRRFAAKTTPHGKCILWRGATFGVREYGAFGLAYRNFGAHRVALIWATGRAEPTLYACHRCSNASCVNADHLYWGSPLDNMLDRDQAKRDIYTKITAATAKQIWTRYHFERALVREMAESLGVSRELVRDVVTGKTWRHVTRDLPQPTKQDRAAREAYNRRRPKKGRRDGLFQPSINLHA